MNTKAEIGLDGEARAERYLISQGLTSIGKRFLTPLGEIDLIMVEDSTLVFVEVKARQKAQAPSAVESITPAKQRRLISTALAFLKANSLAYEDIRFDVVIIEGENLEWISGAFDTPPGASV